MFYSLSNPTHAKDEVRILCISRKNWHCHLWRKKTQHHNWLVDHTWVICWISCTLSFSPKLLTWEVPLGNAEEPKGRIWAYRAFRSIRSTIFILGLASGDVLTQARAIWRIASIWLLTACDALLTLKSRMWSCFVELHNTHLTNSVPSVTAAFPVSNSSRITPKLYTFPAVVTLIVYAYSVNHQRK